jgi:hypothetical protein
MTHAPDVLLKRLPLNQAEAVLLAERRTFQSARATGDAAAAWAALERMHIVSQPFLGPHLASHGAMFAFAIAQRDWREALGQSVRIVLAPLGAMSGWLPWGNSGRATVSAFKAMPLPTDLAAMLETLAAPQQKEPSQ